MHRLLVTTLIATAATIGGLAPSVSTAPATAAAEPTRTVTVTGADGSGVTTWPSYDPGVERYSVRSSAPIRSLRVTASSTDPAATISVDGRPAANGVPLVVEEVSAGDEVNVQVTDSAGTSNQSWIVLPDQFPDVRATGPHPDLAPGHVFLTLSSFFGPPFTAVVDEHGVPAVATAREAGDFKQAGSGPGRYSVALKSAAGTWQIAELDGQFREVGRRSLAGNLAAATDFHDSTLFADGSSLLMGYDYLGRDGGVYTDAIIQRLDPAGVPTWTWNSKDHVDEDTEGLVDRMPGDYAHVNSLQELDNGDVLASFRNLSQVMLIAGSDHDGFASGDVIWRLGGLRNDFDFVGDPFAGPCAQHAAQVLPDGHLMIFDNGSRRDDSGFIAPQTDEMCPDPDDLDGPRVARPQTRVAEYALDTTTTPPTATLVWSHVPTGRYAPFAGNAQRLAGGNTLVGWSQSEVPAGSTAPVATEVTPDGREIWSLTASGYFSYRAFKHDAPDRVAPEVTITSPADGAVVTQGDSLVADFGCTDTGGSNLDLCAGSVLNGASLTDVPGTHELVVRSADRAGNETTASVTWTVEPAPGRLPPAPLPTPGSGPGAVADVLIHDPGHGWRGRGTRSSRQQTITLRPRPGATVSTRVRIRNAGEAAGRMRVFASSGNRWVTARWYAGDRDVTPQLRRGAYRTARLDSGDSVVLRLVLTARRGATGRTAVPHLGARAHRGPSDVVRARVEVR